jgi:hypothetical protein
MPTYKVVHSEYFCATMIILQQFIISGRHGLKASTLHSPRPFRPCPTNTDISTEQLSGHAFTPRQVGRPGRKLRGFERHLLTRSDPGMLLVLANSYLCVKVLHCYLSEKCILQLKQQPATAPSR